MRSRWLAIFLLSDAEVGIIFELSKDWDFFRSKEIDIKKEKVDEIEAFAEGKGLGERALGSKNDEFNDVIDNVFVVNTVVD